MRFALLGSGSKGNATLIEEHGTCLLLDCGFTLRETEQRLSRLDRSPAQLSGILVTHEHQDHLGGVGPLARKYGIPVWLSNGTLRAASHRLGRLPDCRLFNSHTDFAIKDLLVHPFPVPHDAREPCQFVFANGQHRLGVLTDTGRATSHIARQLDGCDALILESNHDSQMLRDGPYPPSLQARVAGGLGHLSNDQAANLLGELEHGKLQHLVAAHLSEQNNRPELVSTLLSEVLGCEPEWIALADQASGLDWREIG